MSDEIKEGDLDEEIADGSQAEQLGLQIALDNVRKRCDIAKIEFSTSIVETGEPYGRIQISSGRDKRSVFVGSINTANNILGVDFENYVFVEGYEAICSYSLGTIEASMRSLSVIYSRAISDVFGQGRDSFAPVELKPLIEGKGQPSLKIGPPSKEFSALARFAGSRRLTLTLSGLNITQNSAAIDALIRYSNSLLFQIELLSGYTFEIERERRRRVSGRPSKRRQLGRSLEYPRTEYDPPAISLYWYAKSARGMPLLQYLAFYQVIEFFYPRYFHAETRRKLAGILKDPTFRGDKDDHIDRIISTIAVGRSPFADERAQLKAVINGCLSEEDARAFLAADGDREAYFSGKTSKQRFHKIPVQNKTLDLRSDIAERVYGIRCKIVHTKNDTRDGYQEMILPFSTEAQFLDFDIELVEFIAKSVLIFSSAAIN